MSKFFESMKKKLNKEYIQSQLTKENLRNRYYKYRSFLLGHNFTDGFLFKVVIYLLLIAISYVFIYPIIRMISYSFMTTNDLVDPEIQWIPKKLTFNTIIAAANVLDFQNTLITSTWVSALLATLQTIVSALTGFAFARYEFKFKNFWFVMVLVSFVIPVPVLLIPRTMLFQIIQDTTKIQMFVSLKPHILLATFGQGVYSAILILIFYNFFKLIPRQLDEAARIDGANAWQVFYHIVIKLSVSTIATVFLFSFVWNWNETSMASRFISTAHDFLPEALGRFEEFFGRAGGGTSSDVGQLNEAYQLAGTLLTILPLGVLYLFVQNLFVEGIEKTGITGE